MATVAKKEQPQKQLRDYPGGQTSWKAGVPSHGWYKMPDEWWRDLPRLQRGLYQRMLIDFAWGCSVPRVESEPIPEWSPWLAWSDLADQFRCSPDQLRDDARDAAKRGMIAVEESRGRARFRILWQKWPNLKDYVPPAPREVERKEQPKPSSHWFSRRVTVGPGETFDFTVRDLPPDFQLQKLSLRNTGQEGPVTITGGGPAEGGMIILETEAEKIVPSKSVTSGKKRESTPQFSLPLPLIEACARFDLLDEKRISALVSACRSAAKDCTIEEIATQIRIMGDNYARKRTVKNVAGLLITQLPIYFGSEAYRQSVRKKPVQREAQKADCGKCDDTGVIGFRADSLTFSDVRRELAEGRELCGCSAAVLWREMLKDAG